MANIYVRQILASKMPMAKIYVRQILAGKMTIDEVPQRWREAVQVEFERIINDCK